MLTPSGMDANRLPPVRYVGLKEERARFVEIGYGKCRVVAAKSGDILTLTNRDGGSSCLLTALNDNESALSVSALGLNPNQSIKLEIDRFDARKLEGLVAARDGQIGQAMAQTLFDRETPAGSTFIFRPVEDCLVICCVPVDHDTLSRGGGGKFTLELRSNKSLHSENRLPLPLGHVRNEFTVARATAQAYEVKKGQFIQVIDVAGQQCSDFMAMRIDALDQGIERYIDSTVTRTLVQGAYPQPGLFDKFFDQDMQPLLSVRQDTVGRHDTFALACTSRGYEERGFPGHINCSDNITKAYEPFGISPRTAWPAINFFFNSRMMPSNNRMVSDEAWSRPGDYVVMQALTDLVCVTTACPDDVDPINGWNPTDIHVRIYDEEVPIMHAVAYRAQPDGEGRLTEQSAFHARTSQLTSSFHVARDKWLPARFDRTGVVEEYWACKNTATLQDMSSLLKFDILGPDAERLLQHCMTRDIGKLSEHRGLYALLCDKRGAVIDDGTLFRLAPDVFRWCCGSENSALHLQEMSKTLGLRVWVKSLSERMVNLALQGPMARDIAEQALFVQPNKPSISNLKWFGFTIARLHDRNGPSMMITRTGFTGELGFEIFCDQEDAIQIWDGLMEVGETFGLTPMGSEALEVLRIEAGLMVAGAEFGPDIDAMEAGLGFAVDFNKQHFNGLDALRRNAGAVRRKLIGLSFSGNEIPAHGDPVFDQREQVGVVTSAARSPALGHGIAMARVAIENAKTGERLEVGQLDGMMKRLPCEVTDIPFIDPKREKPRA